jgi:hypothetical protein
MLPSELGRTWILTNAASLLLCVAAYFWPRAGRAIFAALFLAAAAGTGYIALTQPGFFIIAPANAARLALYRDFILGFFSLHAVPLLLVMAALLFTVGATLVLGDVLLPIGMTIGVVFLALLSPFGTWVAFPTPLLLALGLACVRIPSQVDPNLPR